MGPNRGWVSDLSVSVTRFKKKESGRGGDDGKEARSAVWGSEWLILQVHIHTPAIQVRCMPTMCTV